MIVIDLFIKRGQFIRSIKEIIVHCTASDVEKHDKHALKYLHKFHVLENGWSDIGYHYVISKSKGLEIARPIIRTGSHVRGRNNYSIGIVLCGLNDFDEYQFIVLEKLLINLVCIFEIHPDSVLGHGEIDPSKSCPNIDMHGIRAFLIENLGY